MRKDKGSFLGYGDDVKETPMKHIQSKYEYDLYKEEDDVKMPVIRIKHTSTANKVERWKIFEDSKAMFVIEGSKLSAKEKEFLRSVAGINFLIRQYKLGIKSFSALKKEIKSNLGG